MQQRFMQSRWQRMYDRMPLCEVPSHYAGIARTPFLLEYLATVLHLCPSGGRTLETGIGSGYGAIWLSRRGVPAEGLDYVPQIVERARHVNALLGGSARFRRGDLFDLYRDEAPEYSSDSARYHVVHHQGVLEHFPVPQIRAALAQQVALAKRVVFSVPSVYYPFDPEFGDERLLPLEEWARILEPFEVEELRLYGDPQLGAREHVLGVLRGQDVTAQLRALMQVAEEPYPAGISAIVHTRNEARHIADCLATLQGWTDEIIVCDMESSDDTLALAAPFTDNVVHHPLISNFDRARNVSAMRAKFKWVFYLDADERVPPALGEALRALTRSPQSESLAALLVPFRHLFAGHWMQCLYPGYTAPRLFRNGRFVFNARPHSGAQVEGRVSLFPADDPELALVHHSFDSLAHYLDKLNRYTDSEAANLHRDGQPFHWQNAIRHFVHDFASYYDQGNATRDGVHGFLYSFLSGFYRFEQHAKLFEHRFRAGQLQPQETAIPESLEAMLEYALRVVREKPLPPAPEIRLAPVKATNTSETSASGKAKDDEAGAPERAGAAASASESAAMPADQGNDVPSAGLTSLDETPTINEPQRVPSPANAPAQVVWSGPLRDPSGYGEESRNFLFALEDAGVSIAAQPLPWSRDAVDLAPAEAELLRELEQRAAAPGFTQVVQNFPPSFARHLQAGLVIGRTMFETDRLPPDWVRACNRMDAIWVPSEFNRQSFADSGVAPEKLAVVPGCFDAAPFEDAAQRRRASTRAERLARLAALLPKDEKDAASSDASSLATPMFAEDGFVFLSVFDWTLHKGWDVLLHAFVEEFGKGENVALVLKVWSTMGYDAAQIREQAASYLSRVLGRDLAADPRIRFVTRRLQRAQLVELYGACDAFALPSRGEGWGRPFMEAMACGLPVIGTRWSGNLAFMTDENSYLVDCRVVPVPERGWRELPTYRGHRWAEPDRAQLRRLLRRVVEEPDAAAAVGDTARIDVTSRFNRKAVGAIAKRELERLREKQQARVLAAPRPVSSSMERASVLVVPPALQPPEPVRVRWEGAQFGWHSLAHVNRELCLALSQSGGAEVSLVPIEPAQFAAEDEPRFAELANRSFAPLSGPAQVQVRHFFPPRFEAPAEGQLVLMQPWEYGFLPEAWIEPIRREVKEVWCYSNFVREVYRASGIPEEKLRIVSLGVDTEVFHPAAPPYVFTTEPGAATLAAGDGNGGYEEDAGSEVDAEHAGRFVFLFCGGTLHRKGIDILLEAYSKAFTGLDEVCLVIKDTGTRGVYQGQNERERILALTRDAERPPLIYCDDDLSAHQLAGFYTAAHCLVQPYRGEGFCLPALEAMACGVPVIVPAGGPTDDFVDESAGWRVPARKEPFGLTASGNGRIGHWECVGPTWMLEVGVDDLARLLRRVFQHREEAAAKGRAAAKRVREGWTWKQAGEKALERLRALAERADEEAKERTQSAAQRRRLERSESGSGLLLPVTAAASRPVERERSAAAEPSRGKVPDVMAPSSAAMTRRKAPTVSLCMIVRNEERVLGACLESVKTHVDEIVVVDTGSNDATVAIAQAHGAKVFHFPWCDDFSAARNESLRHATGDWIFWMDADDTIAPECGAKLRELALLSEEETTGFLMQVHVPPAPGESGFTVVDHLKLFRNWPQLRFEGRIHEQILEAIYRAGGRVERSDLYVVHSGYDYSIEGQARKRERDLLLLGKDLEERPDHPFVLFNIGMTAFHLKDYAKAIAALERCLALSKPQESTIRKVYAMLAGCHLAQGNVARAGEEIERGLALFPHDPELLFRGGIVYHQAGEREAAERCYVRLLTQREAGHIDSLDVSMTGFKAHHNLALLYWEMERWEEAERELRAAVRDHPGFVPSWLGLGELYLRLQRTEEARGVVRELQRIAPELARKLEERLFSVISAQAR